MRFKHALGALAGLCLLAGLALAPTSASARAACDTASGLNTGNGLTATAQYQQMKKVCETLTSGTATPTTETNLTAATAAAGGVVTKGVALMVYDAEAAVWRFALGDGRGALVTKANCDSERSWQIASPSGGIPNSTAAVQLTTASSGRLGYLSQFYIRNTSATPTEYEIRTSSTAGSNVIFRGYVPASSVDTPPLASVPIKSVATNQTLYMSIITAAAGIYVNAAGCKGEE